jgi:hypothetical protein
MKTLLLAGVTAASIVACGARADTQFQRDVQSIARDVQPGIEAAVGLEFEYTPNVAVKTREAVNEYLRRKMATEFPPEELARISTAYRLLRLIPEQMDLEAILVDLYTEQVVGFYDPATDTLYVVTGSDPVGLNLIVAHELVHALQAQHVNLDSILSSRGDNDRQMAAQAVFEGQGVLASLMAIMPDRSASDIGEMWQNVRSSMRQQQEGMPVLGSAPLILRETLIFPYLEGTDFVRWFSETYPGEEPYGSRMPMSTEQVLDPERYRAGDMPVELRFPENDGITYQDGLGQLEMRVFVTELTGSTSSAPEAVKDWGGDRYAVFDAGDGHGIVWWSVWDNQAAAQRFADLLRQEWPASLPTGREYRVLQRTIGNRPGVALVEGPSRWELLDRVPIVERITNNE